MTSLQQINETLKEYIKIPLSTFYKIVLTFTVILFIAIIILTVPSFSKLSSFIGLCFLFITTGLLFYGNYQEEQINKDFSEFEIIEDEDIKAIEIIEVIERKSNINESEINRNFIA